MPDSASAPATPRVDAGGDAGQDLTPGTATDFPQTDLENAERLVREHGHNLRYVREWGWLVWDGTRWQRDVTGAAMQAAKTTARGMRQEAAALGASPEAKRYAVHARRSESVSRLNAMLTLAQSDPQVVVSADAFDREDLHLNVLNGVLDLRTGTLRPHARAALHTKLAPVRYQPDAHSAVWDDFLAAITCGDAELAAYLQRAVGYSLTGTTVEECLFLTVGSGRNGKSKFLEALRATLGDYAQSARPETILSRPTAGGGGSVNNDIADLAGARFVVTSELEQGRELATGLVKRLTGGDTLRARFLHKEHFEFTPHFALWIATNHLPVIREREPAIWERLQIIPFRAYFSPEQRDPLLGEKLASAQVREAMLAWAVQGCLEWQRTGLRPPAGVRAAGQPEQTRQQTRQQPSAGQRDLAGEQQDPVARFLAERCVRQTGACVRAAHLHAAYLDWAAASSAPSLTKTALTRRTHAAGVTSKPSANGRMYLDLGLVQDGQEVSSLERVR